MYDVNFCCLRWINKINSWIKRDSNPLYTSMCDCIVVDLPIKTKPILL